MIENFSRNLTRLRQMKNISQLELANDLDIGKQSISDYENQKV
ncbi:MAG: helix-turn-helix transcriptional regulator, partial [Lactococcus raffinolactis]